MTQRQNERRYRRRNQWTPRERVIAAILFIVLFIGAGAMAGPDETSPQSSAVIGLGESHRIHVEPGTKVHISDGGVVRARVIGREVMLTGRRTGRASLRIIGSKNRQDQTIIVTERRLAAVVREFSLTLSTRRGLTLRFEALPDLVVDGELLRIDDWRILADSARALKVAWRLEASVFDPLRAPLRKLLEKELNKIGWPGQFLDVGDRGLVSTGSTESPSPTPDQRKTAGALGLRIEAAVGLTDLEPMIRTRIVLAEVRRSRMRKMGIQWPNSAEASLLPQFQLPIKALTASLEALEDQGEGRILAMPTLLCRSGGEAKFLAGGEIPIKVSTIRSAQVEWKKYGIQLNVNPKADRLKRMKFQLSTEISTLDDANKADGIPGILTNRIETQFNLQGSQTIVLSGLIKREESDSASGIPILRSIPVLGSLFQSEDFRKRLTELVVFVAPEVISPNLGLNDGAEN